MVFNCDVYVYAKNILKFLFFFVLVGNRHDERKCYEQHENSETPLRCPVKLYEFYLSKW
jgi:hypothetical protein